MKDDEHAALKEDEVGGTGDNKENKEGSGRVDWTVKCDRISS